MSISYTYSNLSIHHHDEEEDVGMIIGCSDAGDGIARGAYPFV